MVPFILLPHFCNCYILCTIIFYLRLLLLFDSWLPWAKWLRFSNADDSTYPLLDSSTPDLYLLRLLQKITKKPKIFFLLCNSKEESPTINYCTWRRKGRRGLKGPRRPTEPSDLLYLEKAARLRQQPQLLCFFPSARIRTAASAAAYWGLSVQRIL